MFVLTVAGESEDIVHLAAGVSNEITWHTTTTKIWKVKRNIFSTSVKAVKVDNKTQWDVDWTGHLIGWDW